MALAAPAEAPGGPGRERTAPRAPAVAPHRPPGPPYLSLAAGSGAGLGAMSESLRITALRGRGPGERRA